MSRELQGLGQHLGFISFQNTERLETFQLTLSSTLAELDHNGLLVKIQHGPNILLCNLNLLFNNSSDSTDLIYFCFVR